MQIQKKATKDGQKRRRRLVMIIGVLTDTVQLTIFSKFDFFCVVYNSKQKCFEDTMVTKLSFCYLHDMVIHWYQNVLQSIRESYCVD